MKQPSLENLKENKKRASQIKSQITQSKQIKITINVDEKSLKTLKKMSGESGVPYQRLLNQYLKDAIEKKKGAESRLNKLEREVKKLKTQMA